MAVDSPGDSADTGLLDALERDMSAAAASSRFSSYAVCLARRVERRIISPYSMTASSSSQMQAWIAGLNAGDPAARTALVTYAYEQLRRLTRKMLRDFRRLERWEDADDILHGALERLLRALNSVQLTSVAHFCLLATRQIRQELLDLARHYFGPEGSAAHHASAAASPGDTGVPLLDAPQSTFDPARLALWTELHRRIESLAPEQRDVFELRWYQDLSVEDTAAILGVSEPTVKRRWREARVHLAEFLS